jgi:hypothetical protein
MWGAPPTSGLRCVPSNILRCGLYSDLFSNIGLYRAKRRESLWYPQGMVGLHRSRVTTWRRDIVHWALARSPAHIVKRS